MKLYRFTAGGEANTDTGLRVIKPSEHLKQLRRVAHLEADTVIADVEEIEVLVDGTLDRDVRLRFAELQRIADQIAKHRTQEGRVAPDCG